VAPSDAFKSVSAIVSSMAVGKLALRRKEAERRRMDLVREALRLRSATPSESLNAASELNESARDLSRAQ